MRNMKSGEKKTEDLREATPKKSEAPAKEKKKTKSPSNPSNDNLIPKLKKKIESIEKDIESMELEISLAEEKMSAPEVYSNLEKLAEANKNYEALKIKLEEKNAAWEKVAEEIEALE